MFNFPYFQYYKNKVWLKLHINFANKLIWIKLSNKLIHNYIFSSIKNMQNFNATTEKWKAFFSNILTRTWNIQLSKWQSKIEKFWKKYKKMQYSWFQFNKQNKKGNKPYSCIKHIIFSQTNSNTMKWYFQNKSNAFLNTSKNNMIIVLKIPYI